MSAWHWQLFLTNAPLSSTLYALRTNVVTIQYINLMYYLWNITKNADQSPHKLHQTKTLIREWKDKSINFKIKSQKLNSRSLKVKTQLYYNIYIYIYQTMVTANDYMFRPLTGHHQVVHLMKRAQPYLLFIRSVSFEGREHQQRVSASKYSVQKHLQSTYFTLHFSRHTL